MYREGSPALRDATAMRFRHFPAFPAAKRPLYAEVWKGGNLETLTGCLLYILEILGYFMEN